MTVRISLLAVVAVLLTAAPAAALDDFTFERFPQPATDTWFGDDYGYVRGRHHKGNDVFGEKGDPVVAVVGGVVERVDTGPKSGHYVVVRHGGGWETWYLHLNNDRPGTDDGRIGLTHATGDITEGWWVDAGDIIGFVGDSGNAEGTVPHTHFELRYNGKAVDPHPYLLAVWTLEQEALERDGVIH